MQYTKWKTRNQAVKAEIMDGDFKTELHLEAEQSLVVHNLLEVICNLFINDIAVILK